MSLPTSAAGGSRRAISADIPETHVDTLTSQRQRSSSFPNNPAEMDPNLDPRLFLPEFNLTRNSSQHPSYSSNNQDSQHSPKSQDQAQQSNAQVAGLQSATLVTPSTALTEPAQSTGQIARVEATPTTTDRPDASSTTAVPQRMPSLSPEIEIVSERKVTHAEKRHRSTKTTRFDSGPSTLPSSGNVASRVNDNSGPSIGLPGPSATPNTTKQTQKRKTSNNGIMGNPSKQQKFDNVPSPAGRIPQPSLYDIPLHGDEAIFAQFAGCSPLYTPTNTSTWTGPPAPPAPPAAVDTMPKTAITAAQFKPSVTTKASPASSRPLAFRNWRPRDYLMLVQAAGQNLPFDKFCQENNKSLSEAKEAWGSLMMLPMLLEEDTNKTAKTTAATSSSSNAGSMSTNSANPSSQAPVSDAASSAHFPGGVGEALVKTRRLMTQHTVEYQEKVRALARDRAVLRGSVEAEIKMALFGSAEGTVSDLKEKMLRDVERGLRERLVGEILTGQGGGYPASGFDALCVSAGAGPSKMPGMNLSPGVAVGVAAGSPAPAPVPTPPTRGRKAARVKTIEEAIDDLAAASEELKRAKKAEERKAKKAKKDAA